MPGTLLHLDPVAYDLCPVFDSNFPRVVFDFGQGDLFVGESSCSSERKVDQGGGAKAPLYRAGQRIVLRGKYGLGDHALRLLSHSRALEDHGVASPAFLAEFGR